MVKEGKTPRTVKITVIPVLRRLTEDQKFEVSLCYTARLVSKTKGSERGEHMNYSLLDSHFDPFYLGLNSIRLLSEKISIHLFI